MSEVCHQIFFFFCSFHFEIHQTLDIRGLGQKVREVKPSGAELKKEKALQ